VAEINRAIETDRSGEEMPPTNGISVGRSKPVLDNRKAINIKTGRQYTLKLAEHLLDDFMFFAGPNAVYHYDPNGQPQLTPLNINRLRELVDQKFCALRLVLVDGRYEPEHYQLTLSRQDLTDVVAELSKLAPEAPMFVKSLNPMERDHAMQRLAQGERPESISRAYGVRVEDVLALRRAA
jgi:hypothetical protein